MGESTDIPWCDHTFNGWIGCAKLSPGCANCYAAVDTFARSRRGQGIELWGKGAHRHRTSETYWRMPLKWDRDAARVGVRRRVFGSSLADVIEDRDDLDEWRADLLTLIHRTPNLDWLLLTKRPDRWNAVMERVAAIEGDGGDLAQQWLHGAVMPNIWMGTSVEDQQRADERIPHLLAIPAAVRFLSVEPLLGPVEFRLVPGLNRIGAGPGLDWVIVGGESGTGARPCDLAWIRSIVDQCKAASVPCFTKQLGARPYEWELCGLAPGSIPSAAIDAHLAMGGSEPDDVQHWLRISDPKGGDPDEWPADLRVREFPEAAHVDA